MDPTIPETTQPPASDAAPEQQPPHKGMPPIKSLLTKNPLIIAGISIVLLIFIPLLLFSTGSLGKKTGNIPSVTPVAQNPVKKAAQPTPAVKQPTQTLVYGTWTSQTSVVRAVDLASGTSTTLATLPLSIKKISILSNTSLLYIDQTDNNDYGQRISVYDSKEKQIVTNIPVDNGFGIDNYVLSPNKQYLAIWEVALAPQEQTLQGGQSRVYTVDLTRPTTTNLLYDETVTPTIPIHYPRAVLNDGTVFADQMIPNDPKGSTGWAYGMSTVDFDGTNKQDIASMTNGTYGSQPSLSPDGKYLLFAGYDGSNGDGTAIKNGYRQALLTPNTVELLDTKTMQRYKLPNLPTTNTYSDVQWDKQTGNVILSILSADTKQMGVYVYNLSKLQTTQIPLPLANGTPYGYVSQLTDTKTLVGIQSTDSANLGNLGDTYAYAYTQLATLTPNGTLSYLSFEDPFIQYITVLPGNYFKNVLAAETSTQTTTSPTVPPTLAPPSANANPQLYTFFLKTTLANIRIQEKSESNGATALTCQSLGTARCSALGIPVNSQAFTLCQNTERANQLTANACY